MSYRAWAAAAALSGASFLRAAAADAEPSIWEVARDPEVASEHRLLVEVERMVDSRAVDLLGDPVVPKKGAAIQKLRDAGGSKLADPRLRYLYGELLIDARPSEVEHGRSVLEGMLADDPASPVAAHAWFSVAIASARLEDREAEDAAYTKALDRAWMRSLRTTIFMNRGESRMMAGRLAEAVADYRESIRLARRPDQASLAWWGLAVALERYGDLPSALDAAGRAWRLFPIALDLPTVFFVPSYEVHYYRALAAMARARHEKNALDAALLHEEAALYWQRYADAAAPEDRWVDRARRHAARALERAEALRAKASKDDKARDRRARPALG